jgi:hypothetical protein
MRAHLAMLWMAIAILSAAGRVAPLAAQTMATDRATGCHFLRPADLASGPTAWFGECRGGRAEGPGVLRVLRQEGGPRFFFGTMVAGRPRCGVVTQDNNDDVIAWRFDGARAVEPADRTQTASIYQAAAAGAAAAAEQFRVQGNVASAKYYAGWSHTLSTALDANE